MLQRASRVYPELPTALMPRSITIGLRDEEVLFSDEPSDDDSIEQQEPAGASSAENVSARSFHKGQFLGLLDTCSAILHACLQKLTKA